jgi:hypothetical protein
MERHAFPHGLLGDLEACCIHHAMRVIASKHVAQPPLMFGEHFGIHQASKSAPLYFMRSNTNQK